MILWVINGDLNGLYDINERCTKKVGLNWSIVSIAIGSSIPNDFPFLWVGFQSSICMGGLWLLASFLVNTNEHIGMIYTSSGPSRKEGKRGRTGPAPTCTLPSLRDSTQWTLVKTSTLWSLMRPTPRTGRFHYESLVSPAPPCEPS